MRQRAAVVMLILCVFSSQGCRNETAENPDQTGTISLPEHTTRQTTTDAVTTQTVDVGDTERSPNEGAGSTPEPTTTSTTATTTTP